MVETELGPIQKVFITGPDGKNYIAAYGMQQQSDGTWKINGCSLVEDDSLRDLGEHRLKDLAAPERIYQFGGGEFPPLRSLQPTNLPIPATPFLGRQRELNEVTTLLRGGHARLLTLSGPAGAGKTRLALQAAAEASDQYPDGVFWASLAALRDSKLVARPHGEHDPCARGHGSG